MAKNKIANLSIRNFGARPVKIFASTTMGYVHRKSKNILGLFSKNNKEIIGEHNCVRFGRDKSPGQAEFGATKCALQTAPGMRPRRDFNDSKIEICGAKGSDLVDKQSHANSCIEKTGSNFC